MGHGLMDCGLVGHGLNDRRLVLYTSDLYLVWDYGRTTFSTIRLVLEIPTLASHHQDELGLLECQEAYQALLARFPMVSRTCM